MSKQPTDRPLLLGKRVASYRSLPLSLPTAFAWTSLAVLALSQILPTIGQPPVAALGLLGAAGLGIVWRRRQQRERVLELYQNGINLRTGRRQRHLFWNQIYEIYQVPLFGSALFAARSESHNWMYRLVKRDGRRWRLHGFESLPSLGARIQQQVAMRQLPTAMEAFRAGYTVRFGRRLALSSEGLQFNKRSIAWDEIAEISIDDASELQITRLDSRLPVLVLASRLIPNLAVLDGLLRATREALEAWDDDVDLLRGAFQDPFNGSATGVIEPDPVPAPSVTLDHRPRQPR